MGRFRGSFKVRQLMAGVAVIGLMLWVCATIVGIPRWEDRLDFQGGCYSSLNNIALALDSYRRVHAGLPPPALRNEQGVPVQSWRTLILPFYAINTPGRSEYNHAERWDGPNNSRLRGSVPPFLGCPQDRLSNPGGSPFVMVNDFSRVDPERIPPEAILVLEVWGQNRNWLDPRDRLPAVLRSGIELTNHPLGAGVILGDLRVKRVSDPRQIVRAGGATGCAARDETVSGSRSWRVPLGGLRCFGPPPGAHGPAGQRERVGERRMAARVERRTVDLGGYPDLVVMYLGMRVRGLRGLGTAMRLGRGIARAGAERPDGLLHYENGLIFGLFPLHVGMRWYWRDLESLEAWARSDPHRSWWQGFLRDPGGTGFWHETYRMRGGIEAVYDDMDGRPVGLQAFAPGIAARGPLFSARGRLGVGGDTPAQPSGASEAELG